MIANSLTFPSLSWSIHSCFISWVMVLSRLGLLFEILGLFILSRWSLARLVASILSFSAHPRLKFLWFGRRIESTAHNHLPFLPAFLPKYWLINDHTLQVIGPLSWAFGVFDDASYVIYFLLLYFYDNLSFFFLFWSYFYCFWIYFLIFVL
jgi:hypothetical protein